MLVGGYRIHNEGNVHRYRVPDLLTREEFELYMASTYGVAVEFREFTEEEASRLEKFNAGESFLPAPTPGPTDQEREISLLRKMLGIEDLEKRLDVKRSADPDNRDPVVELDAKTMTAEQFDAKYGPRDSTGNVPVQKTEETPSRGKTSRSGK